MFFMTSQLSRANDRACEAVMPPSVRRVTAVVKPNVRESP